MEQEYDFRHRIPVQVRYADIDLQGHVNNGVYFQLMDLGKVAYFTEVKGGQLDPVDANIVVANINVNFLEPTHFGEELEVRTQVLSVGTRSLRLRQQVANSTTGGVKCDAVSVMVSPVPISDEWIAAFGRFEQRPVK